MIYQGFQGGNHRVFHDVCHLFLQLLLIYISVTFNNLYRHTTDVILQLKSGLSMKMESNFHAADLSMFRTWLSHRFSTPYSEKTLRVYLSVVEGVLHGMHCTTLEHPALVSLSKFSSDEVLSLVRKNHQTGELYSPSYQNLRIAALNLFWTWLVEQRVVQDNPILNMLEARVKDRYGARPIGGKHKQRLPSVLMWDDQEKLLRAISETRSRTRLRDLALVRLIMATGVRCEEVCQLGLAHLDLEYFRIRVNGKGNKERLINFEHDENVVRILQDWIRLRSLWLANIGEQSDRLFISTSGRAMTGTLVYQLVSKYISAAALEHRVNRKGPHVLRHTATSIMFAAGVPLLQIKENLGHSDLATTQIYAHLLPARRGVAQRQQLSLPVGVAS